MWWIAALCVVTLPPMSMCFVLGLIVQLLDISGLSGVTRPYKCYRQLLELPGSLLGSLTYSKTKPGQALWVFTRTGDLLKWVLNSCSQFVVRIHGTCATSICHINAKWMHIRCLTLRFDVLSNLQSATAVTITCANGKWNKQVSCEPVDCGLPDKYHVHPALFDFPEGTTYGKKSTFQCREPAQLVGKKRGAASTNVWRHICKYINIYIDIFYWLIRFTIRSAN